MGHGREKIPRNAMTRLKMAFQLLMECEYVLVVENIRTLGEGREIRKRNCFESGHGWKWRTSGSFGLFVETSILSTRGARGRLARVRVFLSLMMGALGSHLSHLGLFVC